MQRYKKTHQNYIVNTLGCNFAGLTTARYIHAVVKDKADITIIDRKSLLTFVPNIPMQVLANINPAIDLQYKFMSFLEHDGSQFIQAEVTKIDPETNTVLYRPNERAGHPVRKLKYDYLVVALGNRLAYDKINGFEEHGHSVTDVFLGNRLRNYLHKNYKVVRSQLLPIFFIKVKATNYPKICLLP